MQLLQNLSLLLILSVGYSYPGNSDQVATSQILIKVTEIGTHQPLPKCEIKIFDEDGKQVLRDKTDQLGQLSCTLAPGFYDIYFSKPFYMQVVEEDFMLEEGQPGTLEKELYKAPSISNNKAKKEIIQLLQQGNLKAGRQKALSALSDRINDPEVFNQLIEQSRIMEQIEARLLSTEVKQIIEYRNSQKRFGGSAKISIMEGDKLIHAVYPHIYIAAQEPNILEITSEKLLNKILVSLR
jgi:hypothetical protein